MSNLRNKLLTQGWGGPCRCCTNNSDWCCGYDAYRDGVNDLWRKFFDDNKGGCWDLMEQAFLAGRNSNDDWEIVADRLFDKVESKQV